MDEKSKQVPKDTEKFEGVGRVGTAALASTVWWAWGHLIGVVAGVIAPFWISETAKLGKFNLGEWITKHKIDHIPFFPDKPLTFRGEPLSGKWAFGAAAVAAGWFIGGIAGFFLGGAAGLPDGDRGERQFKRMQGKLNDALEENAALKEKLGDTSPVLAKAHEPKSTVHADTLVKSETNLAVAEAKAQAV